MKTALRALAAVFVGLLLSFIVVVAVELFSAVVHPLPEEFSGTPEQMHRHVQQYPPWVLAVVVPAWAVAAFVGTWTARRMGNFYSSLTVGLLLLAALVFNISLLPYPMWFKLASLLAIPTAAVAGIGLSRSLKTAGAREAHSNVHDRGRPKNKT